MTILELKAAAKEARSAASRAARDGLPRESWPQAFAQVGAVAAFVVTTQGRASFRGLGWRVEYRVAGKRVSEAAAAAALAAQAARA